MKAEALPLLRFLKRSPQLSIPIYQRTYSWPHEQCTQLWIDIMRIGENPKVSAHFIGSIVYVESDLSSVSSPAALLVIDGQQRVTTVSILLEALARAVGDGEPEDGFSARKIRNHYLLDPEETGDRRHKLILTQNDKTTLMALTAQQPVPDDSSIRVMENFDFFSRKIAELGDNLAPLCRGLAKLMIVEVALHRDQDNPQMIFESMNSTGLALSQADLIRNFVLMGQEPAEQTRLYQYYWRPMEERFGQEGYKYHFDGFMRHYLTLKTRSIPNIGQVYREFKNYLIGGDFKTQDILEDLLAHAGYYAAMALGQEPDAELASAFQDLLNELGIQVAYPFLLELYHDYSCKTLSRQDFLAALKLMMTYVLRRSVCGVPTNTLNRTFSIIGASVDKSAYLASIQSYFAALQHRYRLPGDAEFEAELRTKFLYNTRNFRFILRHLENQGRKEPVSIADYTIEHILPQNENLSPAWQAALGPDWQQVQATYLHTLGNLTLTGYNSEYSDRPFPEKRDMPGGFAQSPLKLNQGLGQLNTWNQQTILERGARLAAQALTLWPAPVVPAAAASPAPPAAPATENWDDAEEEIEDGMEMVG